MTTHYLGFDLLETFATAALSLPDSEPVYLLLVRENRAETHFQSGLYTYRLVASQIQPNGRVHYWMQVAAVANHMCGGIDSQHTGRPDTAVSAEEAVRQYLEGVGLTCIRATLAMPAGITLLEGGAACLGFDSTTKRFFLKPKAAA